MLGRGKKMSEVVQDKREVGFGDLELRIEKPTLSQDKTMVISGNFQDLGNKIQAIVDRYKGTQLTEDNVSYVKTLKGQFVSLRTGIEREKKEYKKVYITPASRLIDSMCDELLQIVSQGESALAVQLEEYDQKRKDELTLILQEYVKESSKKHNLRVEYETQVQLLDKYYNKTQNEEDSADDIERQCAELEKKQNEYDAGVALIRAECEGSPFIADTYIRELQYKSAMEIVLEIKADKKTSDEIKAKKEAGEAIVVGKALDDELKKSILLSEKESKTELRTRILKVTYKAEQASLMSKFFTENNIAFEFIQNNF